VYEPKHNNSADNIKIAFYLAVLNLEMKTTGQPYTHTSENNARVY
jgi:hypothetical protein